MSMATFDAWLVVGRGDSSPVLAWVCVQGWTPYDVVTSTACCGALMPGWWWDEEVQALFWPGCV